MRTLFIQLREAHIIQSLGKVHGTSCRIPTTQILRVRNDGVVRQATLLRRDQGFRVHYSSSRKSSRKTTASKSDDDVVSNLQNGRLLRSLFHPFQSLTFLGFQTNLTAFTDLVFVHLVPLPIVGSALFHICPLVFLTSQIVRFPQMLRNHL